MKQLWEGHKDPPTGHNPGADLLRFPGCAQLVWLPTQQEHFASMGLLVTEVLSDEWVKKDQFLAKNLRPNTYPEKEKAHLLQ